MDLQEIKSIASYYKFRTQNDGESEEVYRRNLSNHLRSTGHLIESHEVITGRWDTSEETQAGLLGAMVNAQDGRLPQTQQMDQAVAGLLKKQEDDEEYSALLSAALAMGIPLDFLIGDKDNG